MAKKKTNSNDTIKLLEKKCDVAIKAFDVKQKASANPEQDADVKKSLKIKKRAQRKLKKATQLLAARTVVSKKVAAVEATAAAAPAPEAPKEEAAETPAAE